MGDTSEGNLCTRTCVKCSSYFVWSVRSQRSYDGMCNTNTAHDCDRACIPAKVDRVVPIHVAHCCVHLLIRVFSPTTFTACATQVKPKVEAMLLEEIELSEALEESLGKEEIEIGLDAAFEAQGGEQGDLSKAFPVPEEERSTYKESEVPDAEMA